MSKRIPMIDQHALAIALVTEGALLNLQNTEYQPEIELSIQPNGRILLKLCRIVHSTDPLYPITHEWLLNDPRTVVSTYSLSLTETFARKIYDVELQVWVLLSSEETDLLTAVGKIQD
jgi:hypothetical protein